MREDTERAQGRVCAAFAVAVCTLPCQRDHAMTVPTPLRLAQLARRVAQRCIAAGECVTTAESCTGGYLAKVLTDIAGSSEWFESGVVCYSNAAKTRQLGVPHALLARHGAVSAAVARAMTLGALKRSGAERAVALTGIAGPTGAVPGKPVGTLWFGFGVKHAGAARVHVVHRRFRGGRDAVRRHAVAFALRQLARS